MYKQAKTKNCLKSGKGFTLAEVLVTLAIIGVVAALTIPSLIQSTKNAATVTGVKKVYSVLSQAYNSFIADDTTMDTVWAGNAQDANILNQFCSKLNCIKNCGTGTGCFPDINYKTLAGNDSFNMNTAGFGTAILADGTSLYIEDETAGCTNDYSDGIGAASPFYYECGGIVVDINGFKAPNQFGRDAFLFHVTRTGIFPYGSNNDSYSNTCVTSDLGYGCAYKILTEGAINY